MAGAIVGLHVFGPDAGPEPLSNLDNNFTPIANAINNLQTFSNFYVDTGAVNALVVTVASGQSVVLAPGLSVQVQVAFTTSSTAPTLNVGGTGVKTIVDGFGIALAATALVGGGIYNFWYDGTNWRVQLYQFSPVTPYVLRASKPATTTRISVTVLANDPDLVIAIPFAGRWAFEVLVNFFASTTAGMGISANVNYSGTFNSAFSMVAITSQIPQTNYAAPGSSFIIPSAQTTTAANLQNTGAGISTTAASPESFVINGLVFATGAGNLGFSWAQKVSTANNLNMLGGSYITAMQVS